MSDSRVSQVAGPAMVLPGDDIDTDRIMPARFLKAVTFEGLESHLFEDDRKEAASRGLTHVFDDVARRSARVLVVGRNFGCGSSREHAPQAIRRWGIRAVVGESFAEIFFGNSLMMGLPCVTISAADAIQLRSAVESDPAAPVAVDLEAGTVTANRLVCRMSMPESARQALISGAWDATGILLADYEAVRRVAASLPYVTGRF